jgi:hypothetical protein
MSQRCALYLDHSSAISLRPETVQNEERGMSFALPRMSGQAYGRNTSWHIRQAQ